jgi:hypothetical protein
MNNNNISTYAFTSLIRIEAEEGKAYVEILLQTEYK